MLSAGIMTSTRVLRCASRLEAPTICLTPRPSPQRRSGPSADFWGSTARAPFRCRPVLLLVSLRFSRPMTTSHSRAGSSHSSSNGASGSSLSPLESLLSMLNWRPVCEIEQRTRELRNESDQIRNETEQIRKETEQLKQVNARLRQQNAKGRELLSSAVQLCSPPDSSSIPLQPTAPNSTPSSP